MRILPLFAQQLVTVRTVSQLDALARHTYVMAAIIALVLLGVAALIANAIKFEGGSSPRDPGKRRLWFWLLFVVTVGGVFLYNWLGVAGSVAANLQTRLMTINLIATAIAAAVYLLTGFILSKVFSTGKLGNWFR